MCDLEWGRTFIAKVSEWIIRVALCGRGDVYMNLTGKKIAAGTAPSEIVPLLADQLVNCVLWEPAVLGMIKALQQWVHVGSLSPMWLHWCKTELSIFFHLES